jgi:hypothetical protein
MKDTGAQPMQHASFAQILVMAAIVTTLLLPPAAGLVWLGCALAGASFESLVTFGGALAGPAAMLAWWVIVFLPALGYAAFMRYE